MSNYGNAYGYGGLAPVSFFFSLGLCVLAFAAQWRLFTKAGEPGWKCLIPVYGAYVWCKIVWKEKIFWTILGISLGSGVLSGLLSSTMANSHRYSGGGSGAIFLGILLLAVAVFSLVVAIKMVIYTARAYGKGGGFAAGLFFLMPIFYCILAFGSSEYVGPMGIPSETQGSRDANGSDVGDRAGEPGAGYAEVPNASAHGLIWIVVGVCALLLGITSVQRIVAAMTKFRIQSGLFGSPWVGTTNFAHFLGSANIRAVLSNSFVFGMIAIIVSLLFSLLGGAAGMSDSRFGKAIMVAIGAVIAFVPPIIVDYALLKAGAIRAEEGNLLIPVANALPCGGVAMMLGALLPDVWPRNRFYGVLVAPLLALASLFFSKSVINPLQNAINMKSTDTLVTYIYRISFLNNQISVGAAAEVVQSLLNLVPAAVGALLIAALLKQARPAAMTLKKEGVGASVAAGLIAGGLVLLAGIALFSRYPSAFSSANVLRSAVVSLICAFLTSILAFGVYAAVLLLAGKCDPRRWFPFALLVMLSVGFNRSSIMDYMTARSLGFVNTIVMPVLSAVANPLSIMLLIGMIIIRPQRASTCALFALGAAFLSAAYVMFDLSSVVFCIADSNKYTMGMLLRIMLQSSTQATTQAMDVDVRAMESMRVGLIGAALMIVSLPLGAGAGLCFHAGRREG